MICGRKKLDITPRACPDCDEGLILKVVNEARIYHCRSCKGAWVPQDQVSKLKNSFELDELKLKELRKEISAQFEGVSPGDCVDCNQPTLRWFVHMDVEMAFCSECHGIFIEGTGDNMSALFL